MISSEEPARFCRQDGHWLQGSGLSVRPVQLIARASRRAMVVLPTPAGARQQKGVRHAVAADRVGQGLRDVALPHHRREGQRPPAPRHHFIGHRSLRSDGER